jgi:hypothetical protein
VNPLNRLCKAFFESFTHGIERFPARKFPGLGVIRPESFHLTLVRRDISCIPTGHADIKFLQMNGVVNSESFKETLDNFVQHIDKGTFIGTWATQTQQVLGLGGSNYH